MSTSRARKDKKRLGSRRYVTKQNDELEVEFNMDRTSVAQPHIPEENTESLSLFSNPDKSQSEGQHPPSQKPFENKRKLGSSRKTKGRQHVEGSATESYYKRGEEVEEKNRGNEALEEAHMSLTKQSERWAELSKGREYNENATHNRSLYSAIPSEVESTSLINCPEDVLEIMSKSGNECKVVSDTCKSEEKILKVTDKCYTLKSKEVKENTHLVNYSDTTSLSVRSCPTVEQKLIDKSNSREMPEELLNVYSAMEKENTIRDEDTGLLWQDGSLHSNSLMSESYVESLKWFSATAERTTDKSSPTQNAELECSVSLPSEDISADDVKDGHFSTLSVSQSPETDVSIDDQTGTGFDPIGNRRQLGYSRTTKGGQDVRDSENIKGSEVFETSEMSSLMETVETDNSSSQVKETADLVGIYELNCSNLHSNPPVNKQLIGPQGVLNEFHSVHSVTKQESKESDDTDLLIRQVILQANNLVSESLVYSENKESSMTPEINTERGSAVDRHTQPECSVEQAKWLLLKEEELAIQEQTDHFNIPEVRRAQHSADNVNKVHEQAVTSTEMHDLHEVDSLENTTCDDVEHSETGSLNLKDQSEPEDLSGLTVKSIDYTLTIQEVLNPGKGQDEHPTEESNMEVLYQINDGHYAYDTKKPHTRDPERVVIPLEQVCDIECQVEDDLKPEQTTHQEREESKISLQTREAKHLRFGSQTLDNVVKIHKNNTDLIPFGKTRKLGSTRKNKGQLHAKDSLGESYNEHKDEDVENITINEALETTKMPLALQTMVQEELSQDTEHDIMSVTHDSSFFLVSMPGYSSEVQKPTTNYSEVDLESIQGAHDERKTDFKVGATLERMVKFKTLQSEVGLSTNEEHNEHLNTSEVRGAHHPEDTVNKVLEQDVKPPQMQELHEIDYIFGNTTNDNVEKSDIISGHLKDQSELEDTHQSELAVKVTDNSLTNEEVLNPHKSQGKHPTDETTMEGLNQTNEDHHVYDSKKPQTCKIRRVTYTPAPDQVFNIDCPVEDDVKHSAEQTSHQEKKGLFYEPEESKSLFQTLKSEIHTAFGSQPQDNSVNIDKENNTDFDHIENRRKLGSSRRKKGRHHVKDSSAKDTEEDAENVTVSEALETTKMTLVLQTIEQEELSPDTEHDIIISETDGNSLYSTSMSGYSSEVQKLTTNYPEAHLESLIHTSGNLQEAHDHGTDFKVEAFNESVEVTLEGMDKSDTLQTEVELSTQEEQYERFNLSEVRGAHHPEDTVNKVLEQEVKPPQMQELHEIDYSFENTIHETVENSETCSGDLKDQSELEETHQSELTVRSVDNALTFQEVSNLHKNQDEHLSKESNVEVLHQINEDDCTKKSKTSEIHTPLASQPQDNSVNIDEENNTDLNQLGNRRKLGSSRRKKGRHHVKDSSAKDTEEDAENVTVSEALETTKMTLVLQTIEQEELSPDTEHDIIISETDGNSLYSTSMSGYSSEVQKLTTNYPEAHLESVHTSENLQEAHDHGTDFKVEAFNESVEVTLEGMDKSDTLQTEVELSTQEEQYERFNLSEVRGAHHPEDTVNKVLEQEVKPPQMQELHEIDYSFENTIHETVENSETCSGDLKDQSELEETHQSELTVRSVDNALTFQEVSNLHKNQDEHLSKESNVEVLHQINEDDCTKKSKTSEIHTPLASQPQDNSVNIDEENNTDLNQLGNRRKLGSSRRKKGRHHVKDSSAKDTEEDAENVTVSEALETTKMTLVLQTIEQEELSPDTEHDIIISETDGNSLYSTSMSGYSSEVQKLTTNYPEAHLESVHTSENLQEAHDHGTDFKVEAFNESVEVTLEGMDKSDTLQTEVELSTQEEQYERFNLSEVRGAHHPEDTVNKVLEQEVKPPQMQELHEIDYSFENTIHETVENSETCSGDLKDQSDLEETHQSELTVRSVDNTLTFQEVSNLHKNQDEHLSKESNVEVLHQINEDDCTKKSKTSDIHTPLASQPQDNSVNINEENNTDLNHTGNRRKLGSSRRKKGRHHVKDSSAKDTEEDAENVTVSEALETTKMTLVLQTIEQEELSPDTEHDIIISETDGNSLYSTSMSGYSSEVQKLTTNYPEAHLESLIHTSGNLQEAHDHGTDFKVEAFNESVEVTLEGMDKSDTLQTEVELSTQEEQYERFNLSEVRGAHHPEDTVNKVLEQEVKPPQMQELHEIDYSFENTIHETVENSETCSGDLKDQSELEETHQSELTVRSVDNALTFQEVSNLHKNQDEHLSKESNVEVLHQINEDDCTKKSKTSDIHTPLASQPQDNSVNIDEENNTDLNQLGNRRKLGSSRRKKGRHHVKDSSAKDTEEDAENVTVSEALETTKMTLVLQTIEQEELSPDTEHDIIISETDGNSLYSTSMSDYSSEVQKLTTNYPEAHLESLIHTSGNLQEAHDHGTDFKVETFNKSVEVTLEGMDKSDTLQTEVELSTQEEQYERFNLSEVRGAHHPEDTVNKVLEQEVKPPQMQELHEIDYSFENTIHETVENSETCSGDLKDQSDLEDTYQSELTVRSVDNTLTFQEVSNLHKNQDEHPTEQSNMDVLHQMNEDHFTNKPQTCEIERIVSAPDQVCNIENQVVDDLKHCAQQTSHQQEEKNSSLQTLESEIHTPLASQPQDNSVNIDEENNTDLNHIGNRRKLGSSRRKKGRHHVKDSSAKDTEEDAENVTVSEALETTKMTLVLQTIEQEELSPDTEHDIIISETDGNSLYSTSMSGYSSEVQKLTTNYPEAHLESVHTSENLQEAHDHGTDFKVEAFNESVEVTLEGMDKSDTLQTEVELSTQEEQYERFNLSEVRGAHHPEDTVNKVLEQEVKPPQMQELHEIDYSFENTIHETVENSETCSGDLKDQSELEETHQSELTVRSVDNALTFQEVSNLHKNQDEHLSKESNVEVLHQINEDDCTKKSKTSEIHTPLASQPQDNSVNIDEENNTDLNQLGNRRKLGSSRRKKGRHHVKDSSAKDTEEDAENVTVSEALETTKMTLVLQTIEQEELSPDTEHDIIISETDGNSLYSTSMSGYSSEVQKLTTNYPEAHLESVHTSENLQEAHDHGTDFKVEAFNESVEVTLEGMDKSDTLQTEVELSTQEEQYERFNLSEVRGAHHPEDTVNKVLEQEVKPPQMQELHEIDYSFENTIHETVENSETCSGDLKDQSDLEETHQSELTVRSVDNTLTFQEVSNLHKNQDEHLSKESNVEVLHQINEDDCTKKSKTSDIHTPLASQPQDNSVNINEENNTDLNHTGNRRKLGSSRRKKGRHHVKDSSAKDTEEDAENVTVSEALETTKMTLVLQTIEQEELSPDTEHDIIISETDGNSLYSTSMSGYSSEVQKLTTNYPEAHLESVHTSENLQEAHDHGTDFKVEAFNESVEVTLEGMDKSDTLQTEVELSTQEEQYERFNLSEVRGAHHPEDTVNKVLEQEVKPPQMQELHEIDYSFENTIHETVENSETCSGDLKDQSELEETHQSELTVRSVDNALTFQEVSNLHKNQDEHLSKESNVEVLHQINEDDCTKKSKTSDIHTPLASQPQDNSVNINEENNTDLNQLGNRRKLGSSRRKKGRHHVKDSSAKDTEEDAENVTVSEALETTKMTLVLQTIEQEELSPDTEHDIIISETDGNSLYSTSMSGYSSEVQKLTTNYPEAHLESVHTSENLQEAHDHGTDFKVEAFNESVEVTLEGMDKSDTLQTEVELSTQEEQYERFNLSEVRGAHHPEDTVNKVLEQEVKPPQMQELHEIDYSFENTIHETVENSETCSGDLKDQSELEETHQSELTVRSVDNALTFQEVSNLHKNQDEHLSKESNVEVLHQINEDDCTKKSKTSEIHTPLASQPQDNSVNIDEENNTDLNQLGNRRKLGSSRRKKGRHHVKDSSAKDTEEDAENVTVSEALETTKMTLVLQTIEQEELSPDTEHDIIISETDGNSLYSTSMSGYSSEVQKLTTNYPEAHLESVHTSENLQEAHDHGTDFKVEAFNESVEVTLEGMDKSDTLQTEVELSTQEEQYERFNLSEVRGAHHPEDTVNKVLEQEVKPPQMQELHEIDYSFENTIHETVENSETCSGDLKDQSELEETHQSELTVRSVDNALTFQEVSNLHKNQDEHLSKESNVEVLHQINEDDCTKKSKTSEIHTPLASQPQDNSVNIDEENNTDLNQLGNRRKLGSSRRKKGRHHVKDSSAKDTEEDAENVTVSEALETTKMTLVLQTIEQEELSPDTEHDIIISETDGNSLYSTSMSGYSSEVQKLTTNYPEAHLESVHTSENLQEAHDHGTDFKVEAFNESVEVTLEGMDKSDTLQTEVELSTQEEQYERFNLSEVRGAHHPEDTVNKVLEQEVKPPQMQELHEIDYSFENTIHETVENSETCSGDLKDQSDLEDTYQSELTVRSVDNTLTFQEVSNLHKNQDEHPTEQSNMDVLHQMNEDHFTNKPQTCEIERIVSAPDQVCNIENQVVDDLKHCAQQTSHQQEEKNSSLQTLESEIHTPLASQPQDNSVNIDEENNTDLNHIGNRRKLGSSRRKKGRHHVKDSSAKDTEEDAENVTVSEALETTKMTLVLQTIEQEELSPDTEHDIIISETDGNSLYSTSMSGYSSEVQKLTTNYPEAHLESLIHTSGNLQEAHDHGTDFKVEAFNESVEVTLEGMDKSDTLQTEVELSTQEEQYERFNLSEVRGAHHPEDTVNKVLEQEVKPPQMQELHEIDYSFENTIHETVENSETCSGDLKDQSELEETHQSELTVRSVDNALTFQEVSNLHKNQDEHLSKESNVEVLHQINEDDCTKKSKTSEIHTPLASQPQDNSVNIDEENNTDLNQLGNRRKLGSSRRKKGRHHVKDSSAKDTEEDAENVTVSEALETTKMTLVLQTIEQEELSPDTEHDIIISETDGNSLYSTSMSGYSSEVQKLTTNYPEAHLESVHTSENLQEAHDHGTDFKVEAFNESVEVTLEGMDKSDTLQTEVELSTQEEQYERFNLSEVRGAHHPEDTVNKVLEQEVKPPQMQELHEIDYSFENTIHETVENSETCSGDLKDQSELEETHQSELTVRSVDNALTFQEVSNLHKNQDEHPTEQSNMDVLHQMNEDHFTNKPQTCEIERIVSAPDQVCNIENQVVDDLKHCAQQTSHQQEEKNSSLQTLESEIHTPLASQPQDNSVNIDEENNTDLNHIGNRRKLGSSRRKKGRHHVKDSSAKDTEEDAENVTVSEALETTKMTLVLQTIEQEELSPDTEHDIIISETDGNSLYSTSMSGYSSEVQKLTTNYPEAHLESLIHTSGNLQEAHDHGTDFKVEAFNESVEVTLEGMDKSDTLQTEVELSTQEEQYERFNLSEVRGAHHPEDTVNKVLEQEVKPPQMQELHEIDYSFENTIHETVENSETCSGDLKDQSELEETHQSELTVRSVDNALTFQEVSNLHKNQDEHLSKESNVEVLHQINEDDCTKKSKTSKIHTPLASQPQDNSVNIDEENNTDLNQLGNRRKLGSSRRKKGRHHVKDSSAKDTEEDAENVTVSEALETTKMTLVLQTIEQEELSPDTEHDIIISETDGNSLYSTSMSGYSSEVQKLTTNYPEAHLESLIHTSGNLQEAHDHGTDFKVEAFNESVEVTLEGMDESDTLQTEVELSTQEEQYERFNLSEVRGAHHPEDTVNKVLEQEVKPPQMQELHEIDYSFENTIHETVENSETCSGDLKDQSELEETHQSELTVRSVDNALTFQEVSNLHKNQDEHLSKESNVEVLHQINEDDCTKKSKTSDIHTPLASQPQDNSVNINEENNTDLNQLGNRRKLGSSRRKKGRHHVKDSSAKDTEEDAENVTVSEALETTKMTLVLQTIEQEELSPDTEHDIIISETDGNSLYSTSMSGYSSEVQKLTTNYPEAHLESVHTSENLQEAHDHGTDFKVEAFNESVEVTLEGMDKSDTLQTEVELSTQEEQYERFNLSEVRGAHHPEDTVNKVLEQEVKPPQMQELHEIDYSFENTIHETVENSETCSGDLKDQSDLEETHQSELTVRSVDNTLTFQEVSNLHKNQDEHLSKESNVEVLHQINEDDCTKKSKTSDIHTPLASQPQDNSVNINEENNTDLNHTGNRRKLGSSRRKKGRHHVKDSSAKDTEEDAENVTVSEALETTKMTLVLQTIEQEELSPDTEHDIIISETDGNSLYSTSMSDYSSEVQKLTTNYPEAHLESLIHTSGNLQEAHDHGTDFKVETFNKSVEVTLEGMDKSDTLQTEVELSTQEEQYERFNLSEVRGAHHPEDTVNKVHDLEVKSTQMQEMSQIFHSSVTHDGTDNSNISLNSTVEVEIKEIGQSERSVKNTDNSTTRQEVSNSEGHPTEANNLKALDQMNVDYHAYDTKKPQTNDITRVVAEHNSHLEKEVLFSKLESEYSLQALQSEIHALLDPQTQDNSLSIDEQHNTSFSSTGSKRKLGSSRRNKGPQHFKNSVADSCQKPIDQSNFTELHDKKCPHVFSATDTESKEREKDTELLMQWGILQASSLVSELQLKSEGLDPSVTLERATEKDSPEVHTEPECSVEQATVLSPNQLSTNEEQSEHFNLTEVRGAQNSENTAKKVHEEDIKATQIQEMHQINYISDKENKLSVQTPQSEVHAPLDSQPQDHSKSIKEETATGLKFTANKRKLGSSRRNKGRQHVLDSVTETYHEPKEEAVETTCGDESSETTKVSSIETTRLEELKQQTDPGVKKITFVNEGETTKKIQEEDTTLSQNIIETSTMVTVDITRSDKDDLLKISQAFDEEDKKHRNEVENLNLLTDYGTVKMDQTSENLEGKSTQKRRKMGSTRKLNRKQEEQIDEKDETKQSNLDIERDMSKFDVLNVVEELPTIVTTEVSQNENVELSLRSVYKERQETNETNCVDEERQNLGSSTSDLHTVESNMIPGTDDFMTVLCEQAASHSEDSVRRGDVSDSERNMGEEPSQLSNSVIHISSATLEARSHTCQSQVKPLVHQNVIESPAPLSQVVETEHQVSPHYLTAKPSTSAKPDVMSESASGGRRRKMGSHRKSRGNPNYEDQVAGEDSIKDLQKGEDVRGMTEESGIKTNNKETTNSEVVESDKKLSSNISSSKAGDSPSEKAPKPVTPVTTHTAIRLGQESQKRFSLEGESTGADIGSKSYNVLMVGDTSVGKTSFMKRAQSGKFSLDLPASVGLDSCKWTVVVDGKPVVLHLWDTAGQERFHSITRQIFHKAQAFLLMYDITSSKSFSAVSYWANCIQEGAADNVTILLLGNKNDRPERQVKTQDGEILAKEYNFEFMECSAATGENVIQCLETMARMLSQKADTRQEAVVVNKVSQQKQRSGCC